MPETRFDIARDRFVRYSHIEGKVVGAIPFATVTPRAIMKFARRTAAANKRVSLYGGSSGSGPSRDELLAAVDVVRRARECRVAHDVNG